LKRTSGKTISVILKVVPMAMGIAVVVLSILNELEVQSAIIMLGIGLACLGLGSLNSDEKEEQSNDGGMKHD